MSLNVERIKTKVKKGIAIKPTHITLMRTERVSNGMRGGTEKPVTVAELDIFLDDSKHNLLLDNVKESGTVKRTRGLSMLAVVEDIEIKEGDYFISNKLKYKIAYLGEIIPGVYNSDLEVVK